MAFSISLCAACELWIMRSQTPEEFGLALRWLHVPGLLFLVATVGFVRTFMQAGRPWLAWTVCGLRGLTLVLNFYFSPNLNYRVITAVEQVEILGDTISVAVGVPNPWTLLGHLSLMLFAVFAADAAVTVWRRGDRRLALLLGGTLVFFTAATPAQVVLSVWGFVPMPVMISLFFFPVVAVLGFQLSENLVRAAELSGELLESQERFRLAVEASPAAMVMLSPGGHIRLVNTRMESLFGYPRSELIGRPLSSLIPGLSAELERVAHSYDAARPTEGGYEEALVKCRDGHEVPVDIGLSAIMLTEGPCVLVSIVDRTDRERAERENAQHRSELAHLSRVTMLGVLSGSIAHELNQPLTSILSNAQAAGRFLSQEPVDLDEVRDILVDIVDEDKRAGEIIHRLRELLKKGEVRQARLDLNNVVREVMTLVRSDLVNHGVTVHCELAPDLPRAIGDFVQLQQVLLNLLMNACDAMKGNAHAERLVNVRTELDIDGRLRVSVSDRGEGIPSDHLEKVFEPFFTTKSKGLGLGLSVCRSLILAHGGQLWATGNQGPGACFHFTLPRSGVAGL